MTLTVREFIKQFETFAPEAYAVEGDPSGLHFGRMDQEIHKILVTLDVRPEVVAEAVAVGADFIFAHHPPIFRPVKRLTEDNPQQAMYAGIVRSGIAIYAAHTNLDAAPGGMNDWLADLYQVANTEVLTPHTTDAKTGEAIGIGRIGDLKTPRSFDDFAAFVKEQTGVKGLRTIVADANKPVRRVAILGGDGGSYFEDALAKGADTFITGDVYYHTAHDMIAAGLNVIDPGHHFESVVKTEMTKKITDWQDELDWQVEVVASQLNTDPFTFI
ncbi:Nif3-like dinuclear metal center hexameric protein [Aerococcus agrisoli]|uniref:GTP cyclohydrolase 1 type 2 homolog n=1 Tax=Aerococcus agrisoli TaxID=2487350 RepID=A0A3N4GUA0_9LACT|nr:Nif3-like dinuclear metal center hexameric protein [Aerococcus agrisoli]RPA65027.1 Nif3-like dinuclear metal center hexameric protein [Aerococcus agrisoli]